MEIFMSRVIVIAIAALVTSTGFVRSAIAAEAASTPTPTIVLVHGAFADSSSWNGVISDLKRDGYPVVAVANPLRTVKGDADYVSRVVKSVTGDVVLVGHSYGGEVITEAANSSPNVKALVFVAAFAPDAGESADSLGARFPTGTLGEALAPPIVQADGSQDLYIDQQKFPAQFAADVSKNEAAEMAVAQRPILKGALGEPVASPSWKALPSWFIFGSGDKNIPPDLHEFMAKRAGAKGVTEIEGASHVVMISHPQKVSEMIKRAALTK
jgi:pimeloyl-ACP methyl ester carboxylesterase